MRLTVVLAMGLTLAAALAPPASAQLPRLILNEVYVDYGRGTDYPLVKTKFNVYDPVGPTLEQFDQNIDLMGELNIETYRIELAWGRGFSGFGINRLVDGTVDNLVYDFTNLDHMVTSLKEQGVLLHGAYGYNPFPLQDTTIEEYRSSSAPTDMNVWGQIVERVADHYVNELGIPFGVDEVWNEADGLYIFYSGTEEEFKEIYRQWVRAVLSVNPDATIAGPASAPELVWHRSFPEFIAEEKLPLDQFTFHHYGSAELALASIDKVSASLDRFQQFETTAMVLDEWHSADLIEPWCRDDDVRDTFEGAQQLFHDFDVFLTRPELASISWAWYMDPARARSTCMGLISGDGHRKAVFNAWKIYGNMPVDRNPVRSIGPLEAMASSDDHNAAVVIWNPDPYQRRIDVHLENLPFERGNVRVFRIDSTHASWGDGAPEELEPVEVHEDIELRDYQWLDHIIPQNSIIYIEIDDGSGLSELTPVEVATVAKVNRYYPDRGTTSWADFDRKTWIARLGMAEEEQADQRVGVLAYDLPDALTATVEASNLRDVDPTSILAVRVDYRVDGEYTHAVLFHGPYEGSDLHDRRGEATNPWGTQRPADEVVKVGDLARFQMPLAEHAPDGWRGTAHITFILRNAGPGAMAKITLR